MESDALTGKVVAGVEKDGGHRVRIRFTDGTVTEFHAWATYEDAQLDCELFSQDEWHATLTARREEAARWEARTHAPVDPLFLGPAIDTLRRDFNRQMYEPSVIGQYMTIPITGATDD